MYVILACAISGVVGLGLGYGVRGFLRRELVVRREEIEQYARRLALAAEKDASSVEYEALRLLSELRAKL